MLLLWLTVTRDSRICFPGALNVPYHTNFCVCFGCLTPPSLTSLHRHILCSPLTHYLWCYLLTICLQYVVNIPEPLPRDHRNEGGSTHCFSVSPIPDRCPGSICASIACTLLSPLFTPLSWVHLTFSLHKEPQPLDALCPAFSVTVYRAEFTSNSWVLILGKHLVPLSRFLDLGAKLEHVWILSMFFGAYPFPLICRSHPLPPWRSPWRSCSSSKRLCGVSCACSTA